MNSGKIASSFIWRLAERFGAQGVTFVVSLVLARILGPEVYGVLALVTVFTTILQVFVDSGLGTALIQKKDADDLDFSSVFFFNLALSLFLYLLMFFAAPFIAAFYGMPVLRPVVRVLSLAIIISAVKNVQQAYVSRNMLFRKFFFATLGGTLMAAAVGILMAIWGYGVWALVSQYLVNAAVDTLILWLTVKWRPKKCFSYARLKELLSFGWKLLGESLVNTFYGNIRSLVIGKLYSPSELAFYNKAFQLPEMLAFNVDTSLDSVLLPTMSQRQEDHREVLRLTRLFIQLGTYIMMPAMFGLALCTVPTIRLLLGSKWLPSAPFMQLFCVSYAFYTMATANYNAYKALGRSDLYLRVSVISKCIGLLILLVTMRFGVWVIALGTLLSTLVNQLVVSVTSFRLLDYRFSDQLGDILTSLLLSLGMCLAVYLTSLLPLPWLPLLFLQILVGAAAYILLSVLFHVPSYATVLELVRMMLHRKKADA
ncbi:MAG: lipopolysaccharide biosynthesis protein [Oscillospiraceae bacterium]|nr:lipopolysaccharide biosynthesis protein [Oscillospiraceae bacterium]